MRSPVKGTSIVSIRAYVHTWATLPISVILQQVYALLLHSLGCSSADFGIMQAAVTLSSSDCHALIPTPKKSHWKTRRLSGKHQCHATSSEETLLPSELYKRLACSKSPLKLALHTGRSDFSGTMAPAQVGCEG